MGSPSEYGALVNHYESPCPTEIISPTESTDNSDTESGTDSDSSLPSLHDVLLGPKERSITDVKDIAGGAQQKRTRRQIRHKRQTTAERDGSVEIAESPSRSDHKIDVHSLGVTTVMAGSQDKCDSMTERTQQCKAQSGQEPLSSKKQLGPERRSNRDSQVEYHVEMLVNVGGSDVLGIYGQRETNQGREYRCLIGAWLHPDDGIPRGEIQKYNRGVMQSTRRQSLRKRKRDSDYDETDTRVLQKVRQWKTNL
ncbi:hypothetical protein LTR51_008629 [Lithohypha guttulata]|nr:hypothetical protein LTR51_008629 [Lithohypha guttulata]